MATLRYLMSDVDAAVEFHTERVGVSLIETLAVTEDESGSGSQSTIDVEGSETVKVIATADLAKATGEGDEDPGFLDLLTEVSGSGPGDTSPVAGPGSGRTGVRPDDESHRSCAMSATAGAPAWRRICATRCTKRSTTIRRPT